MRRSPGNYQALLLLLFFSSATSPPIDSVQPCPTGGGVGGWGSYVPSLQFFSRLGKDPGPVESWDVQASDLNCQKTCCVSGIHSDGALCWPKAARILKVKNFHQVSHQRKEFCRHVDDVRSLKLSKAHGTQLVERLQAVLPPQLCRKCWCDNNSHVNVHLKQRAYQFVWRRSLGTASPNALLGALAKLPRS